MRDNHVHIGQFADVYYDPLEIMDVVMAAGMDGLSFSSTSSCKNNVRYSEIEREIAAFMSIISYTAETVRPLLWYNPDYIKQNITIESAFSDIPYQGIKIHPYAQSWDFTDTKHMETLHAIFDYASGNDMPVLIHTGNSGVDSADRFERFMDEYRGAKCILAHCRPLDVTMELLKKYGNVYCDTSFVPIKDIQQIAASGFASKVIFGSDFPITHFFRSRYPSPDDNSSISLEQQYAQDIIDWKMLEDKFAIGQDMGLMLRKH